MNAKLDTGRVFERIFSFYGSQFSLLIPAALVLFLPVAILNGLLLARDDGAALVMAVVALTVSSDIGAYAVGRVFGRHKLAPTVSPAKTWEGFAGGIATALAAGLLFASLLDEMTVTTGLALGAIAGLLAPVGDLVESQVKRELGIKDSGRLLPGHGGMLDRLDAIIFCCPALSLYLHFVA